MENNFHSRKIICNKKKKKFSLPFESKISRRKSEKLTFESDIGSRVLLSNLSYNPYKMHAQSRVELSRVGEYIFFASGVKSENYAEGVSICKKKNTFHGTTFECFVFLLVSFDKI